MPATPDGYEELASLEAPVKDVLNDLIDHFDLEDARRVKALEAETNHDVKAVEYFLRERLSGVTGSSPGLEGFLHFEKFRLAFVQGFSGRPGQRFGRELTGMFGQELPLNGAVESGVRQELHRRGVR